MPRSRLVLILGLVGVLVLVGIAGVAITLSSLPPAAPAAPIALASPAPLSLEERRFYQEVAPVLRAAVAEAQVLTVQGRERSRNIFAIRAGQGRLQGHLQTLDAALVEAAIPGRFVAVADRYQPAAIELRAAFRQAEGAFLRLDWESVGAATERLATGTAQLEAASADFDAAVGATVPASPEAAQNGS